MYRNLSLVCFLLFNSFAYAIPEKDVGNLGEVRQSIIGVEDFQRIYGDGWVLMDGRNIEASDLFREKLWKEAQIPDARGVFLRCKNHGKAGERANPDGDLKMGTYQGDQTQHHTKKRNG